MKLIFRKLDPDSAQDIEQFNELMDDLTSRAHDQERLIEQIRRMNRREDAYLMAAEEAGTGRLCGTAMAIVFDDFCDDCLPVMVIENVVTHHDYQHRGVGRRMFEEIEAWGREQGVNYAILCSSMNRTGAHKFYSAVGYHEVRGFKKFLRPQED